MRAREEPKGSGVFSRDPNGDYEMVPIHVMRDWEHVVETLLDQYQAPKHVRGAVSVLNWMRANGYLLTTDSWEEDAEGETRT